LFMEGVISMKKIAISCLEDGNKTKTERRSSRNQN
jgi:hypothetical protein